MNSKAQKDWPYYLIFIAAAVAVVLPLLHSNVWVSIGGDFANHLRHIYEYKLALLEQQFPPLVSPQLNGELRIPLFQYYSGTAYTLPGLISVLGVNEYTALKITIFGLSLLSAIAAFKALQIIVANNRAALLGALTLQLFNFSLVDMYERGGTVEWIALCYAVGVFYSLVALIRVLRDATNYWQPFLYSLVTVLALVLFIPCHPVQTIYSAAVIAILVLAYLFEINMPPAKKWVALAWMSAAFVVSLLLTSWFWLPIISDYHQIKVVQHAAFLPAGTDAVTVLWPWYHAVKMISPEWAPQLGLPISLAVLLLIFSWRKISFFARVSVILLLALLISLVMPSYLHSSFLQIIFSPLQWSYRLLIPLSIVGAVLVALAFTKFSSMTRINARTLFYGCLFLVICNSLPHLIFRLHAADYNESMEHIESPSYVSGNVTVGYTLAGNNYAELGWIVDDKLQLNKEIAIPREGIAFEAALTVQGHPQLTILINDQPQAVAKTTFNQQTEWRFGISPPSGINWQPQTIKFLTNAKSIIVTDAKFRPVGESEWIRVPRVYPRSIVQQNLLTQKIHAKTDGLYQLPISYYAGLKMYVNSQLMEQQSSDKFLTIARLKQGENTVAINSGMLPLSEWLILSAAFILLFTLWICWKEGK